jgi:mRNA-degrading endonuclease RelE of RelBE toxin-antitoxin system
LSEPVPAFEIKFTVDAGDEVRSLDGSIKKQLKQVFKKKLSVDPNGYGTPLRAELVNYYKHEFADHRVIYRIYEDRKLVVVCAVGPRKQGDVQDIYKQLGKVVESGRLAQQMRVVLEGIFKPEEIKPKKK